MKKTLCIILSICLILGTSVMAFAENGPTSDEFSWAYVMLLNDDSAAEEDVYQLVWGSEGPAALFGVGEFDDISYDLATNTLTLDNAKYPDRMLVANEMGDDFKIKLIGDSEILSMSVWGYGWGGSLEITGNGSLTVNSEKSENCPLSMFAEGTDAKLVVGENATLKLNVSNNDSDNLFAYVTGSTGESNPFTFKGEVKNEIKVETLPIEFNKTVPAYMSNLGETFCPYTKSGSDDFYCIKQVWLYTDPDDFDVTENHIYIYELIPCDKVDCGYLMVLKEDLLTDEIPSEYTPDCDMTVTAIDTSNASGGSDCDVVIELATGKEYIVMNRWTDDSFKCILTEPVCEFERNGEKAYFVIQVEGSPTWEMGDELPEGYDYVSDGDSGLYDHYLSADGTELVIAGKSGGSDVTPAPTPADGLADVSGDGKISVVDAKWTLQSVANSRELTAEQIAAADVNKDGKITVVDAKWILQVVAGTRVL